MKIFILLTCLLSTHAFAQKKGLTWGVLDRGNTNGFVNVSCHGTPATVGVGRSPSCDPYVGDTSCDEIRPVLCILKTGISPPANIAIDQYNQWAAGQVQLTDDIEGNKLNSLEAANAYCAEYFGKGWRMAEHHDGWGWGFWAAGKLSNAKRFWVHINDQPGNCWDGQGTNIQIDQNNAPFEAPAYDTPTEPVKPIKPGEIEIPSFLF